MLTSSKRRGLRTWVEISTGKARRNLRNLRRFLPKQTRLAAVTKANAYGHGLLTYSKLMQEFGADWICVDSVLEARALRQAGISLPILAMGYTLPENFSLAKKFNISLTASTFENLKIALNHRGLKIHLKFDTGFSRQGFLETDLPKLFSKLKGRSVRVEGVYTHFAKAKLPHRRRQTDKQIKIFRRIRSAFLSQGFCPLFHVAATAGTIVYPESHFDMVRVGIGLYGLWPNQAVRAEYENHLELRPVLAWRSIISEIKRLPKGRGVGYDFTHRLQRDSVLAVCPVGYWHGYDRHLSNQASVLVRGKRARVLGRVSMGMIVVDVSGISTARVGDVVTLLGEDRGAEVSADELAGLIGTINYEVVTRINPYIRRFYI